MSFVAILKMDSVSSTNPMISCWELNFEHILLLTAHKNYNLIYEGDIEIPSYLINGIQFL